MPRSAPRRAACTSARAWRSCCRCRASRSTGPIGCSDSVIGQPGGRDERRCSTARHHRCRDSRGFAGAHAARRPGAGARRRSRRQCRTASAGPAAPEVRRGRGAALVAGLAAVRELRRQLRRSACRDDARYEIDFRLRRRKSIPAGIVLANGMRVEALADDGVVDARGSRSSCRSLRGTAGRPMSRSRASMLAGSTGSAACVRRRRSTKAAACTCTGDCERFLRHAGSPALLDAADGRGALRLRAGRAVRPAVPAVAVPGDVRRVDRRRGGVRSIARSQYRYEQRLRGRKAHGAAGGAGVLRAVSPDIAIVPSPRHAGGRVAKRCGHAATSQRHGRNNQQRAAAARRGRFRCRQGWTRPRQRRSSEVRARRRGADRALHVTPPATGAAGRLRRAAPHGDGEARSSRSTGYQVVEYPHIHRHHVLEAGRRRVEGDRRQDRARACTSATSWASATRCRRRHRAARREVST